MCGETILAVAKKCKYCLEYFEINVEPSKDNGDFSNNVESSKNNEASKSSIYTKVKTNMLRLVSTNKATKNVTKKAANKTTDIYRFIKESENVTLEGIKESLQINLPDLEEFLSGLIEAGFIYKYESEGEIVYSTKEASKDIDQEHKLETGVSGEISNTIQDLDELQKNSTEEIDTKQLTESITQEVNSKPDQASIHEFYSSINKTSNIDELKLAQTNTTDIDGEIDDSRLIQQDTKLIIEIYTFIKTKENVALRNITKAYNMYNIGVKGVLSSLLNASLIYKYDFGGKTIFSINPDLKDHQAQSSDTDTSKEDSDIDTMRVNDFNAIDYETNIRKVIYAFVEKHTNITVSEIADFFDKEPAHVKGILSKLVETGDVCRHDPADSSDNATYSANTAS